MTKQRYVLEHTRRTTAAIDARRDGRDLGIALFRQEFTEGANQRNRHHGARQRGLRLMATKCAVVTRTIMLCRRLRLRRLRRGTSVFAMMRVRARVRMRTACRLRGVRMTAARMLMFATAMASVSRQMPMRVRQQRDNGIQRHDGEAKESRCSEVPWMHFSDVSPCRPLSHNRDTLSNAYQLHFQVNWTQVGIIGNCR